MIRFNNNGKKMYAPLSGDSVHNNLLVAGTVEAYQGLKECWTDKEYPILGKVVGVGSVGLFPLLLPYLMKTHVRTIEKKE